MSDFVWGRCFYVITSQFVNYQDLCFVQEVQYWMAVILEQRADLFVCLFVCFSTEGEIDVAEAYQPTGGARHHAA